MDFQDIIDFNKPFNEININNLIKDIKSNAVVPYIGAGMSILTENIYPLWNTFLWVAFEKFLSDGNKELFDGLSCEDKADFLYSNIGKVSFSEYLRATFEETLLDEAGIDFINKPVYKLPIIFNKGLLITTNFDKVIEKVYGMHGRFLTSAHPGYYEAFKAGHGVGGTWGAGHGVGSCVPRG